MIGVLVRRIAATAALVVGSAALLGLVFDSGLLGDAALRELGDRATASSVGKARERLGVLHHFDPQALSVMVQPGSGRSLELQVRDGALELHDPARGGLAGRPAGPPLASFPLAGDLESLARALDRWQWDGDPLHAMAYGDTARDAAGLAAALDGLRVPVGEEPTFVGWAEGVPAWQRFGRRVGALLRLDFGLDRDGRAVAAELSARGARSLAIALPAFLLTSVAALSLALAAATLGGRTDRVLTVIAALAIAVPALAWILFLRGWLAFDLGWFPVRPWSAPLLPLLVLPILIWVLVAVWPDLRLYRALALEHARADWMRTARAAGLPKRRLVWRHLLPAVAAPVLARVAVTLPYLFTGSLLLEQVFDIPGLGSAVIDGVRHRDENLLRATTFLFAVGFLLAQWLADALAALCDPRLRRPAA